MPSPFPGMDAFLEHPAFFPGLHERFHVYMSEALQGVLPAPYFAEIRERLCGDLGPICRTGYDRDPRRPGH